MWVLASVGELFMQAQKWADAWRRLWPLTGRCPCAAWGKLEPTNASSYLPLYDWCKKSLLLKSQIISMISEFLFHTKSLSSKAIMNELSLIIFQTGSDLEDSRDYLSDAYETTQQIVQVRVRNYYPITLVFMLVGHVEITLWNMFKCLVSPCNLNNDRLTWISHRFHNGCLQGSIHKTIIAYIRVCCGFDAVWKVIVHVYGSHGSSLFSTETELDPQNRSSSLQKLSWTHRIRVHFYRTWVQICQLNLILGETNCKSVSRTWFLWKKSEPPWLPYMSIFYYCHFYVVLGLYCKIHKYIIYSEEFSCNFLRCNTVTKLTLWPTGCIYRQRALRVHFIILLLLSNRALYWFTAVGSETIFYSK